MLEPLALGRGALDRLAELRTDALWLDQALSGPDTVVVGVAEGAVAMAGAQLADLGPAFVDPASAALLGRTSDGRVHVAAMLPGVQEGMRSLREVGATLSDDEAAVATAAVALEQWHRRHTHCPLCGTPTHNAVAGWERHCPADGSAHYPRTDPAVIVVVHDGWERILLARQQVWPERRFSLVAGYVEPGETAEHAVLREVLEEVGLPVGEPQYLASQPWPFPASLMLCYAAPALSTDFRVDGTEIEEAFWVSRPELLQRISEGTLLLPSPVSIARRAIEHWFGEPLPDGS